MQKTTSQKALKVISIIMIVFAALTLLLGIGGIVTGGALGILGAGSGDAAFAVLSALGTFFGGSADGGDIASALFGLVLPLVCVLLAYNIKKENHL